MASLVLSVAGAAVGGAVFGPAGAIAGRIVGAIGGALIDRALFSSNTERNVEGPRLADLDVMASTEGAPIPRVYGRARLAGQVIWATKLEEVVSVRPETDESGGGKGGGPSATTNTTTYTYFANFAVGLCLLADFGNRIPQLSFELARPLGELERMVRAVTLIPGTTEFGYETRNIVRVFGPGQYAPENRHVAHAVSDVEAALDDLQGACPNVERVAIVVAWFGNDLRADQCTLTPAVDSAIKRTFPLEWSVGAVARLSAPVVSTVGGRPAYGGTPSDDAVKHLIQELLARGIKVTLYPFIVMDIPASNALTDPYTGAASQPAYPWRGRITCNPAPGRPGSPDGTGTAATQIAAFFTGYRDMILHYANLAAESGGVNAFIIGSELRGLTRVRSASGVYPAVGHLATLAADVKAILGGTTVVTYAADWTEYGAHVVDGGASEVRFPLDPLWASPGIDAVGIDYYAPLSDWRDGSAHLDRQIADSIYDRSYLAGNLRGGDAYDWFYATTPRAPRRRERRSPTASASRGCFASRTSGTGGAMRMSSA